MNTYDWSITRMICNSQQDNESNVVIRVRWRCTGSDGDHSVTKSDFCNVTYNSGENFTNYNDLTENQVLGWVFNQNTLKADTEAEIDKMLNAYNLPPIVTLPLPWAN